MCKFDVEMRGLALILLFMFAVWSCTSPVDGELSRAEGLMEEHPDSALVLLEGIGSSSLTTDGSRALYALLLTQARDKNYIDETDDSLISVATEYFGQDDEPRRAMLSSFYHGRILMNGERYPEALCYMTRAYDGAEALGDNFWMGRAAEQMSVIYDAAGYGTESMEYAEKAVNHLSACVKPLHLSWAMLNLARVNTNCGNEDESNALCLMVADSARKYSDYQLFNLTNRLMAKNNFIKGRYSETASLIETMSDTNGIDDNLRCFLGLSYLRMGYRLKSDSVLSLMGEKYSKDNVAVYIEAYSKCGDYKNLSDAYRYYCDLVVSEYRKSQGRNFCGALTKIREEDNLEKESEITSNRRLFVALSCVLLIIILFLLSLNYLKKRKIESNVLIADNLREILSVKETENREIIDTVHRIVSDKYEIVDRLCQELYEKPSKIAKEKISEIVESLLKSFTSGENIMELEGTVRKCYGDVLESLKSDVENIKREDYLLFVYTILGFSSNTVALLLGESNIQAVYNRKKRLKQKLRKLPTEKQVKYRHFLG